MTKKPSKTPAEFEREYFPNRQLKRLEKRLCDELGLDSDHQHMLSVNKDDPNKGLIEVAIPPFMYTGIEGTVAGFYKEEGYDVKRNPNTNIITIKKEEKEYWVHVTQDKTSHIIFVTDSPLKNLRTELEKLAYSK